MADLPEDVRALFEGPNFAHIATVLPDVTASLARQPRVALSIVDQENP